MCGGEWVAGGCGVGRQSKAVGVVWYGAGVQAVVVGRRCGRILVSRDAVCLDEELSLAKIFPQNPG